jgi:cytoskeletal protein RodZ
MNTDLSLFEIVMLALLGLVTIVLIVIAAALGKLARAQQRLAEARERRDEEAAAQPHLSTAPSPEPQRTASEETEPQETAPAAEPAPAGSVTPQREHAAVPAAGSETAAARTEGGLQAEREPQPQPEPEEEPFERYGRWWFRRGEELLVYDEVSGQWMPAPTPSPSPTSGFDVSAPQASGEGSWTSSGAETAAREPRGLADWEQEARRAAEEAHPSGHGQTGAASLHTPGAETEPTHAVQAPTPVESGEPSSGQRGVAGFWKCPSCGAVNGSTATSCRMCFAQRP